MTEAQWEEFLSRLEAEKERCKEEFERWYSTGSFPSIHDFCLDAWAFWNLRREDEFK